jgi:hypothetical protein
MAWTEIPSENVFGFDPEQKFGTLENTNIGFVVPKSSDQNYGITIRVYDKPHTPDIDPNKVIKFVFDVGGNQVIVNRRREEAIGAMETSLEKTTHEAIGAAGKNVVANVYVENLEPFEEWSIVSVSVSTQTPSIRVGGAGESVVYANAANNYTVPVSFYRGGDDNILALSFVPEITGDDIAKQAASLSLPNPTFPGQVTGTLLVEGTLSFGGPPPIDPNSTFVRDIMLSIKEPTSDQVWAASLPKSRGIRWGDLVE